MASVDIFSSAATSPVSTSTIVSSLTDTSLPSSDSGSVEPLTINEIKMFESLDLHSSDSSGIGNSNEAIIEGSLDETDSLLEDSSQFCKLCK